MNPATAATLHSGIARAISREQMANLPIRRYEVEVCLLTTPRDLERARADIRQESVVGFDTATRPAFRAGQSADPGSDPRNALNDFVLVSGFRMFAPAGTPRPIVDQWVWSRAAATTDLPINWTQDGTEMLLGQRCCQGGTGSHASA